METSTPELGIPPVASWRPSAGQLASSARRGLLGLLLLAYTVAAFLPQPGHDIRAIQWQGVPFSFWLLGILLFCAGFAVDERQARGALLVPGLLLASLASLWLVPLVVIGSLSQLPIGWPAGVFAGLGLVALMPAATSSVTWSQLSGGNVAVSIALVVLSTLACSFSVTGVILIADGWGSLQPGRTSAFALLWLLPVAGVGSALRASLPSGYQIAVKPYLSLTCTVCILLLNYSNAVLALPLVVANLACLKLAAVVVATTCVCLASFAAGELIGFRAPSATRRSVVFGVGMKNTGVALVIAGCWLESLPFATLSIVIYTLTQHVLAAGYQRWTIGPKQLG